MFLLVVSTVLTAIHYYMWKRYVADTGASRRVRWIAAGVLVLLAALIPVALVMRRVGNGLDYRVVRAISWPGMVWVGTVFIGFVVLVFVDVTRLVVWLLRRGTGAPPADPSRRKFLSRVAAGAAATATTGAVAAGMASALGRVAVKKVEVPLARLPRGLDGTTIVQLTDVHVGPTIGKGFIEEIVAEVNALGADLVAITGDLVDGRPHQILDAVSPLAGLRSRWGTFFVTGNHEYYSGVHAWMPELEKLGIRVLRNERVTLGEGDARFDLAGTDDYGAARRGAVGHAQDIPGAMAGRDPSRPVVLMAHQPRSIVEAAQHGVDLQLSGHTHGGQIWPWRYAVYLEQPYVAGLARHGDSWIYVSKGTGYLGPPMRLGAPAEVTRIVLRCV